MKAKSTALTGALTMRHMTIGTPKPRSESVLTNAPRDGFTAFAARFFNTAIPVDDVTELDAKLLVARMDFAKTLAAVHSGKQTAAVRRATLVGRN